MLNYELMQIDLKKNGSREINVRLLLLYFLNFGNSAGGSAMYDIRYSAKPVWLVPKVKSTKLYYWLLCSI